MESIGGRTPTHRHAWVTERDPALFGQALCRRLDDVHDEGGTVVHISTQATAVDGGLLFVGQVVYRALAVDGMGAADVPTGAEEPMTLLEEQVAEIVDELA